MQVNISKTLKRAVRNALAQAQKLNNATIFPDLVFLELVSGKESHATYILKKYVKDWELSQIRTSVERELAKRAQHDNTPFDREALLSCLNEGLGVALEKLDKKSIEMINSGHFLLWIIKNNTHATSRALQLYGVAVESVSEYVQQLPAREDYYDDMRVLERLWNIANAKQSKSEEIYEAQESTDLQRKDSDIESLGVNLTQRAKEGKLDDVIGRDKEIERLVQVLSRRKKSNPVLIGEAGVGKSAVIEGLALRIAMGQAPAMLKDKKIFSLDIGALVSGTRYRGDFEERIKALINHLEKSDDTILFIDELHNIVGAGGSQGSMDAANLLKAALARGDIKCIGATTLDEYRTHIEKDSSLERRFQKIMIEPMSARQTLGILEQIKLRYEKHHNVKYSQSALAACVGLTERYLTERNFPDKAIDLLDESGAIARLRKGGSRRAIVEASHVEHVIMLMTGIPAEQLEVGEIEALRDMSDKLSNIVVGQETAVQKVVKAIRRGRTGLSDPNKPLGVFMFVGPTGVGKTHLAKELSKIMFRSDNALIRIDMSEYAEKYNMSRLTGSPPGYVGHNEGGHLTESVRRHPYSVVLFDEIEKAHPDLFNLMLQILDEGHLTDGLGRKIDFRNTIIIMTSNAGSRTIANKQKPVGYLKIDSEIATNIAIESDYRSALESIFAPEFINRIDDIVIFNTLENKHMATIVDIEISRLTKRVEALGFNIDITPGARLKLVTDGYEPRYGVRSLKRTILDKLEEPFADMIIDGYLIKGDSVTVDVSGGKIEIMRKIPA